MALCLTRIAMGEQGLAVDKNRKQKIMVCIFSPLKLQQDYYGICGLL